MYYMTGTSLFFSSISIIQSYLLSMLLKSKEPSYTKGDIWVFVIHVCFVYVLCLVYVIKAKFVDKILILVN